MCEIFKINPGQNVERERLYNAAANNWHSWGVIVKRGSKLLVEKSVPEGADLDAADDNAGGVFNDIDRIQLLLEENVDYERYVHFRHATKGAISDENTHPFQVYKDRRREVWLMHNGTINSHGSRIWRNGQFQSNQDNNASSDSDTKEFVDKKLIPALKWIKGNYHDKDFVDLYLRPLYEKYGGNSRIIIISNDLPPLKFGTWTSYMDVATSDTRYEVSDTSYIMSISRGPVKEKEKKAEEERRKEEQKKRQEELASSSTFQNGGGNGETNTEITPYKHNCFRPDPQIHAGIIKIFKAFGENLAPNELSDLYFLSVPEWSAAVESLIKEEAGVLIIAGWIDHILKEYYDLYSSLEKAEKSKKKGEDFIIQQKSTIAGLEASRKKLQEEVSTLMGQISKIAKESRNLKVIEGDKNVA
jgi:hypothetical protein